MSVNINAGTLSSVFSLHIAISEKIGEINRAVKNNEDLMIEWDFREATPGKINVAALSFFLSIAFRLSKFTKYKQDIIINWNPKILSFLHDIKFVDVSNSLGIFTWPFNLGGYDTDTMNPNSKIMSFANEIELPDYTSNDSIMEWKKNYRESFRQEIVGECLPLFTDGIGSSLPLIVSRTCAELATNSILWGKSIPFIGLQRTREKIFVSVCDMGEGLKNSLIGKKQSNKIAEDYKYIVLASIINQRDFGLKRAIQTVIEQGGNISISSGGAEIIWGVENWPKASEIEANNLDEIEKLELKFISKATVEDKIGGMCRSIHPPIRGVRISFNMPIGKGV